MPKQRQSLLCLKNEQMWHFRIWFSRHGGVGWMVGVDDFRGLFQPTILRFSPENAVIFGCIK